MFRYITTSLLVLFSLFVQAQISEFIHVDQFGYQTDADKIAVISDPLTGDNSGDTFTPSGTLELRNLSTDAVVYTGNTELWNNGSEHIQSGDKGWHYDFSSVTTPGTYYIYDVAQDVSSASFKINDNPYSAVLNAATKMYYYNRCNATKDSGYVNTGFDDPMNFMNPLQDGECRYVYDASDVSLEKDLSGGWFDAGDYNKYVTFTHSTIHDLLAAYERTPEAFSDETNIPESNNGTTDLIDEVKWELDWLMKMTNTDGTVHNKMGSIDFSDNDASPPSANTDQRYYGPECTSSSIAIASIFARAAIVYEDISGYADFAQDLEDRAVDCWDYFITEFDNDDLEYDCDDGTIKAGDADWDYEAQRDAAVVAGIYLYELTDDSNYNDFVNDNYADTQPIAGDYWGPYKMPVNEALLRYTSNPNATTSVTNTITNSATAALNNNWEGFYLPSDTDLYIGYMPDYMYNWGSNSTKSSLANMCLLFVEYDLVPGLNSQLEEKAASHLHYMHGVNPLGLVMLSSMYTVGGDRCVDEVYHTWFNDGTEYDNILEDDYGPAPGFLTGGPNASYSGTVTPPAGQPVMKSYHQWNTGFPESSWEITEPAIYYNAAYVRLASYFVNDSIITSDTNITAENNCVQIHPNPISDHFTVTGLLDNYTIQVVDAAGAVVISMVETLGSEAIVDTSTLGAGTFFIVVENIDHTDVCVKKIIKE
jgi:hypothetical protein